MADIRAVTDADFGTEVLKSDRPVLVDTWAEWCGPCHLDSPSLQGINAEHGDKLTFVQMDVEQKPLTPAKYEVTGIPALYVYRNGELVGQIVGAMPKAALLNELGEFIG